MRNFQNFWTILGGMENHICLINLNIVIFLSAREFCHIGNMHSMLSYTCHPPYISNIRINNNIRWLTTKTRKEIDTIYVTEDIELDEYPPREKIARNKSMAATVAGALSGIEEGQEGGIASEKKEEKRQTSVCGSRASRGQVEMTWNGGEPCGV